MSQTKPLIARLSPLIDYILITLLICKGNFFVHLLTPHFGWDAIGDIAILKQMPLTANLLGCAILIVLTSHGFYKLGNLQRPFCAIKQILNTLLYFFMATVFYLLFTEYTPQYRHLLLVAFVVIPSVIYLRYLSFHFLQLYTPIGKHKKLQLLVVGTRANIEKNWKTPPPAWQAYLKQAYFAYTDETTLDEVQRILRDQNIQIAYIAADHKSAKNNEVINICKELGIDIYFQLLDHCPKARIEQIGDDRILILSYTSQRNHSYIIKEIMDRVVAFILLVCSLPLWIIAAIGIKISDPKGPILYRQMRSGRFGVPFSMWKFRSMEIGADKRLDEIKQEYGNEMEGPTFKLKKDPRIFKFGHFIRKTSIDELPQLINILLGDMSIVGPRPLPLYETNEFPNLSDRRRLSVKPGLTCYWQIENRSGCDPRFCVMVQKDLKYIDNWSLWLDIKLFLRTIPAVLFRRGAQ